MMHVLGIEASCDETAVAIVREDRTIVSHAIATQHQHEKTGGVVPEVAARLHLDLIPSLMQRALSEANIKPDQLSAIAGVAGPGLMGGLMVALMAAKGFALAANKPLIAVNHLEGHALTVRLTDAVEFPYLLLLVSGGNSQFLLVKGVGQYERLGATRDDAAGEAFDKSARLLGLGFPGGVQIEQLAKTGNIKRFHLPIPMQGQAHGDLSFSGLKTAVAQTIQQCGGLDQMDQQARADLAAGLQYAVAEALADRLDWLLTHRVDASWLHCPVVVAGGVAANQTIRARLLEVCAKHQRAFVAPPLSLCTDNAVMIAWAGLERFRLGMIDGDDVVARPRWPLTELTGSV